MRNHNNIPEVREQKSIYYFLPESTPKIPFHFFELYSRMFIEDLSNAVLPIWRSRPHDKSFVKTDQLEHPNIDKYLIPALNTSRQGYHQTDLDRSLNGFFQSLTSELCFRRQVIFEIVYLKEDKKSSKVGFDFVKIDGDQMIYKKGRWNQMVPPDIANKRGVSQLIGFSPENLMIFTLPDHLASTINSTLNSLRQLSGHDWYDIGMRPDGKNLNYDFAAHENTMKLALAEGIRKTGWGARDSLRGKVTNYYSVRQLLKFKLFTLEVREALLSQLNTSLQRIGSEINWNIQLSIEGLLTQAEISKAFSDLELGERPFIDIMNPIFDS